MNIKKELKSWGIIGAIFLVLYLTGLHTHVAAFAQRAILSTGLITADTEISENPEDADFDFQLKNLNGEVVNLIDYKGKVIFLNIWATWCPPCIAEMPGIQSLYEKVDKDKIVFVMLSTDNSEDKARKFIEKKGFTFPVFMAASRVPDVFRVPSIPSTFVISPEGQIVSKEVGMANYDKKSFINFLDKLSEGVSDN
ncbi:MAG TPA: TlpA disulfide reductase family protein [Fulvivirga sp.]|nr:TlpA disulfide reductase family protein [Fulvivirga sp.]